MAQPPIRLLCRFHREASPISSALLAKAPNLSTEDRDRNRGGAGGTIGAELAARSDADGYTMFLGTSRHAINPTCCRKLSYDPQRDLAPAP